MSTNTATILVNGESIIFNLRDFMVALARIISPNATAMEIQEIIFNIFGIRISEEEILAAQAVNIALYDFNGDGLIGNIEDFGVVLGALFGLETAESIEQVCLGLLQVSCKISPNIELPQMASPAPFFPGFTPTPFPSSPTAPGGGGGTESSPAPTPTPSPTGDGQPSGLPPANGLVVRITDQDQIDGQPRTTGDSISLQATAVDEQGNDWSRLIEWLDHQGRPMGSGPSFTYNAGSQALMETITARVRTAGRASFDRVSFTVSPPDVKVAPHIKVLPDRGTQIIQSTFDPDLIEEQTVNEFTLILRDNQELPTLKTGDFIVGANMQVPPMRIKELRRGEGVLELVTELVWISELIFEGGGEFSGSFDLSITNLPEERVLSRDGLLRTYSAQDNFVFTGLSSQIDLREKYIQNIPQDAFVIPLIYIPSARVEHSLLKGRELNILARKFKTSGIRGQLELLGQGYLKLNFEPNFQGEIRFGREITDNLGISYFNLLMELEQSSVAGFALDGQAKIDLALEQDLTERALGLLNRIPKPRILFAIGPIPAWVEPEFKVKLGIEPSLSAIVRGGNIGFDQNFNATLHLGYDGSDWFARQEAGFEVVPFLRGNTFLDGSLKLQIKPEVQFKIYSGGGPKVAVVPSATGSIGSQPRNYNTDIQLPLPSSYRRSDKVPLLATTQPLPTAQLAPGLSLDVTAFSTEDIRFLPPGFLKGDFGRFSFDLLSPLGSLGIDIPSLSVDLPYSPQQFDSLSFWIGWEDSELGYIAESKEGEVLWLGSCFFDEEDEGVRSIKAVVFSAGDFEGRKKIAESSPINIVIDPPDTRCPDFDPEIKLVEFPEVIEDGTPYPLLVHAGLRDQEGNITTGQSLEVEIQVLSNNGSVSESMGSTDSDGIFTTTAVLDQNLGNLQLGIIVRYRTTFNGEEIVLEDRGTISAKDICDIEPNCNPPAGGGLPIVVGFGSGGNPPGSGGGLPGGGGGPTPTPTPTPTPLPECEDCSDGFTIGDPHFKTLDGLYYAFHGQGEFWLVKSDDDEIQIQTRQIPVRTGANVTLNAAVAIKMGSQRLGFYGPQVRVDGAPISINVGNRFVFQNGGVLLRESSSRYRLVWPNGEFVRVNIFNEPSFALQSVDLEVFISSTRLGRVSGLLGNFDRNRANDITTRSGQTLLPPVALDDLYNVFGESWRITQSESLFDYEPGQDTSSFVGMPTEFVTSESLDPDERDAAEAVCRSRGITDPALLEACTVDVAIAGEAFASVFTDANPPIESLPIAEPPTIILSVPASVTLGDPITLGLSVSTPSGLESIRLVINGPGISFDETLSTAFTGCSVGSLTCEFTYPFPSSLTAGTYSYRVTVTDQTNRSAEAAGSVTVNAGGEQPLVLDPGLEAIIREAIAKPSGSLLASDLINLRELNAKNRGIQTLAGLPPLPSLESLDISDNRLQNLIGLPSALPELRALSLGGNQLNDLTGLPLELPKLEFLGVGEGSLRRLNGLPSTLPSLKVLSINGTGLISLEGLPSSLPALELLSIWPNELRSLEGLPTNLPSINNINISSNFLTDIERIVDLYGNGLSSGDNLNISFNCLAQSYLVGLPSRLPGVNIEFSPQKNDSECPPF
ncbi:VWD domain-containing protein [Thermostichus vulcanus]|uniref:VWD domain-containing protein n=1 Tax=Thermostichus vulcanus str. 'Rupite' TaxID=2813851 RepID=A0ABT0C9P0_THEVL|nr:VWD domain-containing protein [Thermostichus vulcanus str. 'Rupite']